MVQFRNSKKFGPLRLGISKRGISSSVGGGPIRMSLGADGKFRRTLSAPGVGLYDTKVIGGGESGKPGESQTPGAASGGFKHPVLALVAVIGLGGILWTACTDSRSDSTGGTSASITASAPASPSVPWTGGPKDGTWPDAASDRIPYGTTSTPTGVFRDYAFAITQPPQLTTDDGGSTVTMTSNVTVTRVAAKSDPGETIPESNKFMFSPGFYSAASNESHGVDTDVSCQKSTLAVGESTVCKVAFTAPASEIKDSYWSINAKSMATWPSQL
jgi:hypothetical protein